MKYVISWFERPQGSPAEYENAQKRILEVFGQWKAPANFKIEFFVVRVGEWGGRLARHSELSVNCHPDRSATSRKADRCAEWRACPERTPSETRGSRTGT